MFTNTSTCKQSLGDLVLLSINGIKDEDAVEPNIIERRVFCNYSDAEREEIAGKISVRFVSVHLLLVLCFLYICTL